MVLWDDHVFQLFIKVKKPLLNLELKGKFKAIIVGAKIQKPLKINMTSTCSYEFKNHCLCLPCVLCPGLFLRCSSSTKFFIWLSFILAHIIH